MNNRQLAIDFFPEASYRPDSFVVGEGNRMAWEAVTGERPWQGPALVLHGPPRSGKTHLARIWAERHGATFVDPQGLADAEAAQSVVIEDADRVNDPQALFHLYNRLAGQAGGLLLTSRTPPAGWSITLPDLRTRIAGSLTVEIAEPDDEMLARLIIKLADDRQLSLKPDVVQYLIWHLSRSFAIAERTVQVLDLASVKHPKGVTKPLVRSILQDMGEAI